MPFHKLLVIPAIASGALLAAQEGAMPEAPAKEVVVRICATCHEIETAVGSRRTKIGWERNVEDMVARGAEGTDEEKRAIVEYLTKYFGKVNVNTASVAELEKAVGFTTQEAQAIAAYRTKNGKIKDFEELTKIPGVGAEKLQAKRGLIAFSL